MKNDLPVGRKVFNMMMSLRNCGVTILAPICQKYISLSDGTVNCAHNEVVYCTDGEHWSSVILYCFVDNQSKT